MAEAKTLTLTEFLAARIGEDDAAAKAAGSWLCEPDAYGEDTLWENAEGPFPQPLLRRSNVEHHFDHIARHDPARVLAECEAKRQAIDAAWMDHCRIENEWGTCMSRQEMEAVDDNPAVIECLALPYAEHPDYRQAWML